jgi:hypothetical protein
MARSYVYPEINNPVIYPQPIEFQMHFFRPTSRFGGVDEEIMNFYK